MYAQLILADQPDGWVEFECGRGSYRARRDPMYLGPEEMSRILQEPRLLWQLYDDSSQVRSMTACMAGERLQDHMKAYLSAVGLSFFKLAMALHALEDIELLEVDLLRIGLDVREWLDPAGDLSTRRVVSLYRDLLDRPETRVGSKRFDVNPITKDGLAVALFHSSMTDQGFDHPYLKAPVDLEQEAEQARIDREKRERMSKDRRVVLQPRGGAGSFETSKSESLRMLEQLQSTM